METDHHSNDQLRWLGVELRHLAALQAVATEGSFGRAAEALGYTQSAISQQIATLERVVGVRLVERPGGPRPVALTEAGRLLLRHADSIMSRLQAAQADMTALANGRLGALRVGTFQSVGAKVLPRILSRFREEWPEVDVQLRESAHDEELTAWVESGELDMTFVQMPAEGEAIEEIELLRDPYALVVRPDAPLASRERTPTLKELVAERLIGYRVCRATQAIEAQLRTSGREPEFVFRSDDNGIVQGMVAAGVGSAIMPRLTIDEGDTRVRIIELGSRLEPRLIGIARHADRYHSPAAEAFVETARLVCAELQKPLVVAA
jgi:DNA-binding transcriptional LysR family regulator